MAIARDTLNKKTPDTCDVRTATGDEVGGTTLPQNAKVAKSKYGVELEVHTGSNVATPSAFARNIYNGRGAVGQGNTRATIHTEFSSSETAKVNHAAFFNEGRGWNLVRGVWTPDEVLVYDPLADGRRKLDDAPSWWPWDLCLEWFSELRPWGDTDPRKLGPHKIYCAYTRDTEPHVILKHGAVKTHPFPDRTRAYAPGKRVRLRSAPSTNADVVDTMKHGELFVAYQVTKKGSKPAGSKSTTWYGDQDGEVWVHDSGLNHEGGST